MRIGAALVLLAVGAILRFAIATTSTHGANIHVIGDILMIVGVIGLIIWLIVWGPWARSRRPDYPGRSALDDEDVVYRQDPAYRRDRRY